jgi:putative transposase
LRFVKQLASNLLVIPPDMPRPSRQAVLGDGPAVVHLIARCNNGEFLFESDEVKQFLYDLLLRLKLVYGVLIHCYEFMDNHIHIVLTFRSTDELSKFMQRVFTSLAMFINKRLQRGGHVFGERARTPVIQSGRQLLTTMRYVELNAVRAGMVAKAKDYKWSSYRYYAFGEDDPLVDPTDEYLGLSPVAAQRRRMYQELVNHLSGKGQQRIPEMSTWYFIGDTDWVVAMRVQRGFMKKPRAPG